MPLLVLLWVNSFFAVLAEAVVSKSYEEIIFTLKIILLTFLLFGTFVHNLKEYFQSSELMQQKHAVSSFLVIPGSMALDSQFFVKFISIATASLAVIVAIRRGQV